MSFRLSFLAQMERYKISAEVLRRDHRHHILQVPQRRLRVRLPHCVQAFAAGTRRGKLILGSPGRGLVRSTLTMLEP
jgi:hypothetical protein